MPLEKPLPLMIGDKAFYSLTSYDPCKVTVEVPQVTDDDVVLALEMTVEQLGGTMESLSDPAWVAERFDGITSRSQVNDVIRQQLASMNAEMCEEMKLSQCIEVLRGRLVQAIPPQHLEQARQAVQMRFEQSMAEEGMTPQQFLARTGTTSAQLEAMFDQQAREMAEADAALSAYAHEKRLKVDEQEIAPLIGLPADQAKEFIAQARLSGHFDDLREMALRSKAAQLIVSECSCTYVHESAEQARARVAQYRQMQRMFEEPDAPEEPPAPGKTGFKLV